MQINVDIWKRWFYLPSYIFELVLTFIKKKNAKHK